MQVNDAKGTFYCFGCAASGDIVSYIMDTKRISFREALRFLGGADLPAVDPAQRAKAAEEDAAERSAAIAEAQAIWASARAPQGTPADIYLASRAICMPLPPSIRFGRVYAWKDADTGEIGPELPALIGAVTTGDEITGLQRIFLADGGRAKARMKKPKKSLGRIRGGALRLDHGLTGGEIIITEGPEDGLSLAQELPDKRVWVALGTAMMPEIVFPSEVRTIVIAGQNDDAGRVAVDKAALRLVEQGFAVRTMFPASAFKDWNDQLRGIRK